MACSSGCEGCNCTPLDDDAVAYLAARVWAELLRTKRDRGTDLGLA